MHSLQSTQLSHLYLQNYIWNNDNKVKKAAVKTNSKIIIVEKYEKNLD